jgi:hypothetical protein
MDSWLAAHVLECAGVETQLTLRGLRQSARRRLSHLPMWQKDQMIKDTMDFFESHNWVQSVGGDNRNSGDTWAINPQLSELYRDQQLRVRAIRQSRLEEYAARGKRRGRTIETRTVRGLES